MKQMTLTTRFLVIPALIIAASSCQKAAERDAKMADAINGKVMEVKDIGQITGGPTSAVDVANAAAAPAVKRIVYVSKKQDDVQKLDEALDQKKVDATKAKDILAKVSKDETKADLEEHLKTGAVALVIMKDHIKVLKVVPDVDFTGKYKIQSLRYTQRMQAMDAAVDAQSQGVIAQDIKANIAGKAPRTLGEKFGLVELTSIKIEKMGVLENERTEYGEKKSILNITEKPLSEATHIVLGEELGSEAEAKATEAAKAAAEKGE